MHRFYAPDIEATLTLPEQESQHAVRVLRMKEGDDIEVVDGKGGRYLCRITMAHPKHCAVEVVEMTQELPHWKHKIVLAIAPTKNLDRMEWMAEKVTEMGIDCIIPLRCRYSERKELKTERLNKILVSAMKQSLKSTLPELEEMTPIMEVIKRPFSGTKYIAYCDPGIERKSFSQLYKKNEDTLILVGPEGDFSQEEIRAALDADFIPVTFGESRLRTETAAAYAIAACHAIDQL